VEGGAEGKGKDIAQVMGRFDVSKERKEGGEKKSRKRGITLVVWGKNGWGST